MMSLFSRALTRARSVASMALQLVLGTTPSETDYALANLSVVVTALTLRAPELSVALAPQLHRLRSFIENGHVTCPHLVARHHVCTSCNATVIPTRTSSPAPMTLRVFSNDAPERVEGIRPDLRVVVAPKTHA